MLILHVDKLPNIELIILQHFHDETTSFNDFLEYKALNTQPSVYAAFYSEVAHHHVYFFQNISPGFARIQSFDGVSKRMQ